MTDENLNRVKMGVAKDIKNSGKSVRRDEFVWGQYSREQSVSGVICVEGDLYVYTNNDFGGTIFFGPFDENEAIGYISNMFYVVKTSAKHFSRAELHQIRQTALHSYSAVLEQSQKKRNK